MARMEHSLNVEDGPLEDIVHFAPDDPERAVNWPPRAKWASVIVLSCMTFVVSISASMSAPGMGQAMVEFHSSSGTMSAFVVSVYTLGLACGPLIVAPLSEIYGRLIPYHVSNVLFILFTVACALSPNLGALTVFRWLAGMAAAAVMNIGGATIGDLFAKEERGRAISIWTFGPLLGPTLGPVAGGFLSEARGWRFVFWVNALGGFVGTAVFFIVMRETYPRALLERKVRRLRLATGNQNLRADLGNAGKAGRLSGRALARPILLLLFSPIVLAFSIFIAIVYGYQYLLITTIPLVFSGQYGFSEGAVGLSYLGLGVGLLIGNATFGRISDRILQSRARNREMKPEYRLPLMIPAAFLIPTSFFLYGWTAEYKVFWLVPIMAMSLMGFGLNTSFMTIEIYLIDLFTHHAASALAATTILRSLVGALLPLAGPGIYEELGLGWGNSCLGFIALGLIPIPFLFMRFGERVRTSRRFQVGDD